jgi:hypothetical protein
MPSQNRKSLTKVNDVPVTQTIDDFKSLAKMKLTGEVTDENNNLSLITTEVAVTIFDKTVSRTTYNDGNSPPTFNVLGEAIFRGNASVTNSQFEFSFVVPRDIRIPVANGRISLF